MGIFSYRSYSQILLVMLHKKELYSVFPGLTVLGMQKNKNKTKSTTTENQTRNTWFRNKVARYNRRNRFLEQEILP